MKSKSWVGLLALVVLLLAACGGGAGSLNGNVDAGAPAGVESGEAGTGDEAMMDDVSDGGVPGDTTSNDTAPANAAGEDMTAESTSGGDMADGDMADDDMADDDMADDDMANDDMANDDMADDDMADDDMADDDMADSGTSDGDMTDDDMADDGVSGDMMASPAWLSAELSDVAMNETFTLADFQGKVVLVELMAIWCPSCLRQQQEVLALHDMLGMRDDLVTVALDIDPNEDAGSLRDYAAEHGFDWYYAVAPRDVAREIGQLYGDQFLSPPSTPMLIVDRHGEVHPLPFGLKTAADLEAALEPFLGEEDM